MSTARYALYFTPAPGTALARFGAAWLGYDVATGTDVPRLAVSGISSEHQAAVTADARRYGFHGTLKPPFHLRPGSDPARLLQETEALAGRHTAFHAPALQLAEIGAFLALVPSRPDEQTPVLAAACVTELDALRAEPSPSELARRRAAGLTANQEALLQRWGYPYVMEEFRFHLTLSKALPDRERAVLREALAGHVAPLCRDELLIDAISVLEQPAPQAPFSVLQRFALAS